MICDLCGTKSLIYTGLINPWYECRNCGALYCDPCSSGECENHENVTDEDLYKLSRNKKCPRCNHPVHRKGKNLNELAEMMVTANNPLIRRYIEEELYYQAKLYLYSIFRGMVFPYVRIQEELNKEMDSIIDVSIAKATKKYKLERGIFTAFVRKIFKNDIEREKEKIRRSIHIITEADLDDEFADILSSIAEKRRNMEKDITDVVNDKIILESMKKYIDSLTDEERTIFIYRNCHGWKYSDICEKFDIKKENPRSIKARACEKIRKKFMEDQGES